MYKSLPLVLSLSIFAAGAYAASTRDDDTLAPARQMQLEFRQGNYPLAHPLVTMLEEATAKSPNNPALWEALGHAHMSRSGTLLASQPDPTEFLAATRRARTAYARSLELHPDSSLARSSHGMASLVIAQFEGDAAGMAAGAAELNAAVRQSPKSIARANRPS